eukprot:TRINITY_DN32658_c0_g1_i1.p1 TRINITY_DN32658_c0_g1~~TRINITY_DN32658_c0_g1_i1.p1  ORF type:complete len:902 (+),score=188.02 TRINITY_DN32658_c0_g1_i1:64-2706(+)
MSDEEPVQRWRRSFAAEDNASQRWRRSLATDAANAETTGTDEASKQRPETEPLLDLDASLTAGASTPAKEAPISAGTSEFAGLQTTDHRSVSAAKAESVAASSALAPPTLASDAQIIVAAAETVADDADSKEAKTATAIDGTGHRLATSAAEAETVPTVGSTLGPHTSTGDDTHTSSTLAIADSDVKMPVEIEKAAGAADQRSTMTAAQAESGAVDVSATEAPTSFSSAPQVTKTVETVDADGGTKKQTDSEIVKASGGADYSPTIAAEKAEPVATAGSTSGAFASATSVENGVMVAQSIVANAEIRKATDAEIASTTDGADRRQAIPSAKAESVTADGPIVEALTSAESVFASTAGSIAADGERTEAASAAITNATSGTNDSSPKAAVEAESAEAVDSALGAQKQAQDVPDIVLASNSSDAANVRIEEALYASNASNGVHERSTIVTAEAESVAAVPGVIAESRTQNADSAGELSTSLHQASRERLPSELEDELMPPWMSDAARTSFSRDDIDEEGPARRRLSAHVAASARSLMAAEARSAAQAAVAAAGAGSLPSPGTPRFRSLSETNVSSPRRRAEDFLAGRRNSSQRRRSSLQLTEDRMRHLMNKAGAYLGHGSMPSSSGSATPTSTSSFSGVNLHARSSVDSSQVWHTGLARRTAEVEASVQGYRIQLRGLLEAASSIKSALYDADRKWQQGGSKAGAEVMLPEVWSLIRTLVDGDLASAASMQTKAEEDARLHSELSSKLRVTSAALEVEATSASCDALRGRIQEVLTCLTDARRAQTLQEGRPPHSKAEAHSLIRSFTAVLLPELHVLEAKPPEQRTQAESVTINFLRAAMQAKPKAAVAAKDSRGCQPASPDRRTNGTSALAQARAAARDRK